MSKGSGRVLFRGKMFEYRIELEVELSSACRDWGDSLLFGPEIPKQTLSCWAAKKKIEAGDFRFFFRGGRGMLSPPNTTGRTLFDVLLRCDSGVKSDVYPKQNTTIPTTFVKSEGSVRLAWFQGCAYPFYLPRDFGRNGPWNKPFWISTSSFSLF